jgi:hypothetical protein
LGLSPEGSSFIQQTLDSAFFLSFSTCRAFDLQDFNLPNHTDL